MILVTLIVREHQLHEAEDVGLILAGRRRVGLQHLADVLAAVLDVVDDVHKVPAFEGLENCNLLLRERVCLGPTSGSAGRGFGENIGGGWAFAHGRADHDLDVGHLAVNVRRVDRLNAGGYDPAPGVGGWIVPLVGAVAGGERLLAEADNRDYRQGEYKFPHASLLEVAFMPKASIIIMCLSCKETPVLEILRAQAGAPGPLPEIAVRADHRRISCPSRRVHTTMYGIGRRIS